MDSLWATNGRFNFNPLVFVPLAGQLSLKHRMLYGNLAQSVGFILKSWTIKNIVGNLPLLATSTRITKQDIKKIGQPRTHTFKRQNIQILQW